MARSHRERPLAASTVRYAGGLGLPTWREECRWQGARSGMGEVVRGPFGREERVCVGVDAEDFQLCMRSFSESPFPFMHSEGLRITGILGHWSS